MMAVVCVLATGAFGFAGYIPETDQVESVEVSYNGSPSYLTEGFSGTSGGASYYYTSYRSYAKESSIDIVRSLHGQLIDSAREPRETDYTDFRSTGGALRRGPALHDEGWQPGGALLRPGHGG